MSDAILRMRDLRVRYGTREALAGVSLALRAGEVVALVGPNGSGKSTLLRAIAGLGPRAASGTTEVGGTSLAKLSRVEIARRIAYLPQSSGTEAEYLAREVVELGRFPHLGAFRPPGEIDRDAIERAMREAGVVELADRPFPALSEGERQRVLLARCFAQEAPVLVLDEPTSSLDVRHAWTLVETVRARAAKGTAVLLAVHDLALAARAGDRVVVLAGGRVLADAPPLEALTPETLAEAFGVRARVARGDEGALTVTILGPS